MIKTLHLFSILDTYLLDLLHSLTQEQWLLPTSVPHWNVKDIAAHLLDGNLRTLSILRDRFVGDPPTEIQSYGDLVAYINRLNAHWVQAMRRVSTPHILAMLAQSGEEYRAYLATLDPMVTAEWSVAWAGEQESKNWFHIAREYTEKWHHQQQIRLAIGEESVLMTKELYAPYLETSVRALPHHYRMISAENGTIIQISITGEAGGAWYLHRHHDAWHLTKEHSHPHCHITIAGTMAWRMFTNGMKRAEAESFVRIDGDRFLGEHIFDMLAVMA
jgi:uncharacterized protein (TIGR03083 family)